MKLVIPYMRVLLTSLLRTPAYWLPVIFFPTMMYAFIGAGNSSTPELTRLFLGSWSVFAVIGIALFQFGVSISQARISPWDAFLRTLPTGPGPRFAGQVIVALMFSVVAGGFVWLTAILMTDISMPLSHWMLLAVSMLIGAIPFSVMGIALGYIATPQSALPIANMLYLLLAFVGGLFMPPASLPDWVGPISAVMPTRHYAELAWGATLHGELPLASVLWLVGYAVVFALLARMGWQRDEMKRHG